MIPLLADVLPLWHALPLVVAISLVYAATRHEESPAIIAHATRFGVWVIVFMAAVLGVLWLISSWV